MTIKILQGNSLDILGDLEKDSIDTCVTSPPYWGLRDYGTATWVGGDPSCSHKRDSKFSESCSTGQKNLEGAIGDGIYKSECPRCGAIREDEQLGLEETPEEYVNKMADLFDKVKDVLKPEGTLWLNLGDSYIGGGRGYEYCEDGTLQQNHIDAGVKYGKPTGKVQGYKPKDLVGIPWMMAFELRRRGWWLRQDIIWHKPNPMPESVTDRCTKSHEYIFLLSKSKNYYYDYEAVKEEAIGGETRNKRSVWTVNPKPYKEAHFAVYPTKLIEPCILAGCPEKVCKKCGEAYKNEEIIIPQEIKLKEKSSTHGKYETEFNELAHRQGLHANRGTNIIEFRPDLPKQKQFVTFMRNRTNAKILSESTDIPLTKIEHWFRKDKSGFSFPTVEDWDKCRDFVNDWSEEFNDMDKRLSHIEFKTDDVKSVKKKIVLTKQCDCDTNETEKGIVLDPFGGSGTTGLVADRLKRSAVLIELNPDYVEIMRKRLEGDAPLFTDIIVES